MKTCFALALCAGLALVALAQTDTFRITGIVVDDTGQPVADALVEAYQDTGGVSVGAADIELKKRVVTGTDGMFEFALSRVNTIVLARKPGHAPAWWDQYQSPSKDVLGLRLVLPAPSALAGLVVDESGKPVGNAEVFVCMALAEAQQFGDTNLGALLAGKPARVLFSTQTDTEGRFKFDNFFPKAAADLAVLTPGRAVRLPRREVLDPALMMCYSGDQDIKLVVEPLGCIEGKVLLEQTGQPVAGARLTLQSDTHFYVTEEREPVVSDTNGAFRMSGLSPGVYRLHTAIGGGAIPEYVAGIVEVMVEPGKTNANVRVGATRGGLVEVTVLEKPHRNPVERARVSIDSKVFWSGGNTDSKGVALMRVPAGKYQVGVSRKGGYVEKTVAVVIEPETTNRVEIELSPLQKLSGTVRYPDGNPASGLKVILIGTDGSVNGDETVTDNKGRFEIEWRQSSASDTTYYLLIRDAVKNLAVAHEIHEGTGPVDLQLIPGLTVTGQVQCDGKPVTNADVALVFWVRHVPYHMPSANAKPDVPGEFEIPALPVGHKFTLNISAPGFGQHAIDIKEDSPRQLQFGVLELKPANMLIMGCVLDTDNAPVAGARVELSGNGQPNAFTRTDRQGRFRFDNVCEGRADLRAKTLKSFGGIVAMAGDTNVVIRLGEVINTSYEFPPMVPRPTRLSGEVKDPDGKPARGVEVTLFPSEIQRWVKTDDSGLFNLACNVLLGQSGTALVIARDTIRNLAATKRVGTDNPTIILQLTNGLTVVGQVVDADGKPIANASVEVTPVAFGPRGMPIGKEIIRVGVDTGGGFEVTALPTGVEFIVRAGASGYGSFAKEFQLTEGQTNQFKLEPFILKPATLKLAGRVLDSNEKPVAGARVRLSGEGQPRETVVTDNQGRFAFEHVCEGKADLLAVRGWAHTEAIANGGDTNVVIVLSSPPGIKLHAPTD